MFWSSFRVPFSFFWKAWRESRSYFVVSENKQQQQQKRGETPTMSSTRPNLVVQIAVQWVAWALSAGMTIFLLPFLILFWLWSALTDYSDTVKKKDKSSSKRSLVSRGLGTSQFVQLKVKSQFSFFFFWSLRMFINEEFSYFLYYLFLQMLCMRNNTGISILHKRVFFTLTNFVIWIPR